MHYELWGIEAGNLIARFDAREEALDLVRELPRVGWRTDQLSLSIESDDEAEDDSSLPIWQGTELEALVRAAA